jgi:hypothetical protein
VGNFGRHLRLHLQDATCLGKPMTQDGTGDTKVMQELMGRGAKPRAILLMHHVMESGRIGVWFRLIRENDSDVTGWVTPDDAEIISGCWGRKVQWLTRLRGSALGPKRAPDGVRRNFSAEDRVSH